MYRTDIPTEVDVAILGAGPCGLGALWRLEQETGPKWRFIALERNDEPGGSASSFTTKQGFTFDLGGHVLYPHEQYSDFKDLLEDLIPDWYESLPIRGVWMDRKLVPYPIQRNLHRLSPSKLFVSMVGIAGVRLRQLLRPKLEASLVDLQHHLRHTFGRGLTRVALGPLNRKMWAHEPNQLSSGWTTHRSGSAAQNVPNTSLRQLLASVLTRKDNPGWSDSSLVRYPASGGTGAIWRSLSDRLSQHIVTNADVVGIDAQSRELRFANGGSLTYKHLISTVPLDDLIELIDDNTDLVPLRSALKFAQAGLIGFGFVGEIPEHLRSVHSFHIPQRDVQCWRITIPSNVAPGNAPSSNHWSILCEISSKSEDLPDIAKSAETILDELTKCGVLPKRAVPVSVWFKQLKHGYPVPFLGRDSVLGPIHEKLAERGILSRGRFGGWKYEVSNQDHTFMQGVEAVDHICSRGVESTYCHPAVVN